MAPAQAGHRDLGVVKREILKLFIATNRRREHTEVYYTGLAMVNREDLLHALLPPNSE